MESIIDTVKESEGRYRIVLNHQFDMEVDEGEYYAVRREKSLNQDNSILDFVES